MKNNEQLQHDVQKALQWEPQLSNVQISVTVDNGIIVLRGTVDSYGKKSIAEKAAKNVTGVKAVVEKIDVRMTGITEINDEEITNVILNIYKHDWKVPDEKIFIKVEHGWVTLEGEFNWYYQREAAKDSIRNVPGVKGVVNKITIKAAIKDEIEREGIEDTLQHNWNFYDKNIRVAVSGTKVTLEGKVDSCYQKEEAGRIAWEAPGVNMVNNQLEIV